MRELLTICPSRSRPERLSKMLKSFNETSLISDLLICLDYDDPLVDEYEETEHTVIIQERMTITNILNKAFKDYPDYKYYHITNDDVVYRTKDWDYRLTEILKIKKGGISYGNDLLSGGANPAHPCIDGRLVRALGWLQMPTLIHLYGDTVWKHIGHSIGKLFYLQDVIIEHETWMNLKADMDEVYKRTNNADMYKKDQEAWKHWLYNNSYEDIQKAIKSLRLL